MRVGHAREERYAHGAEATTLELALVFSYARQLSSSRLSLIMRRTSLKEKKNKTKNVQPGSTCLALLLQYELKSSVTTRFITYESSNLSCNKSCCGRLWKFVAGSQDSSFTFCNKICTCCAFYRPTAKFFRSERRNSPVWLDSRVIVSNQKSVHAQLATTGFAAKTVRFETGW